MRRRTEAPRRGGFQIDAFNESVEREIEIQPRLLAIGDDIKPGVQLVLDGDADRVINHLAAIGFAELVEMLAGELQPAREGVAADDGGAKRVFFHGGMKDEV
jgi:hypothetical protein